MTDVTAIPANDTDRRWVTVEEMRQTLGISKSLIYRAINDGEIRSTRIGSRILIPKSEAVRLEEEAMAG
jgi:excisionase family DNA binding protein|tara:strand:- start:159 stop:365 length:207 start_codon:yes stop_codon:yes gene_type:complete